MAMDCSRLLTAAKRIPELPQAIPCPPKSGALCLGVLTDIYLLKTRTNLEPRRTGGNWSPFLLISGLLADKAPSELLEPCPFVLLKHQTPTPLGDTNPL